MKRSLTAPEKQTSPSSGDQKRRSFWSYFLKGVVAGAITSLFAFLISLGGFGPFPPQATIEAFFGVVPASIQEAGVQSLGIFAKYAGLAVAVLIYLALYGLLGVFFERYFVPGISRYRNISRFEKFLLFSFVPWIVFDIVVLWAVGDGPFGLFTIQVGGYSPLIFPFSLLLTQLIFGALLSWRFAGAPLGRVAATQQVPSREYMRPGTNIPVRSASQKYSRRTFIEKGVLTVGAISLLALSLDKAISVIGSEVGPAQITPGQAINTTNEPAIFLDPRLANLVNSEVTSNSGFYKVTINVIDPTVNASDWSLQVKGLVGNPGKTFTLSDLQNMTSLDQYSTFECVSNNVNGNLIGNAKWTGVKISDLLNAAGGASQNAKYVVFYSVDGYSVGIPLSKTMMPDSILAYSMNGVPLPSGHGYPLRAVIPGIYGMMSAKWLQGIELVDSVYSGYWQNRGWTNNATVNTLAFISVPGSGDSVSLSQNKGSVILGGVAFAGDRGISRVEVSVDGGKTWQVAILKPPISNLTWVLWAFDWHPSSTGSYNVYARATDGSGSLQTSVQNANFPNGATGYVMIPVNVVS